MDVLLLILLLPEPASDRLQPVSSSAAASVLLKTIQTIRFMVSHTLPFRSVGSSMPQKALFIA